MGEVKRYPWYHRISIKQAFAVTLISICAVIVICSFLIIKGVNHQRNWVRGKYDSYFSSVQVDTNSWYEYQMKDIPGWEGVLYEEPVLIMGSLILLITVLSGVLGGRIYYRWKLGKPIAILTRAAEKIAENDLDFRIHAPSDDELGRLCISFEAMRSSLKYTNRQLWYTAEESKRLNAAFAHDLRTPLTVLQGYGELIEGGAGDESLSSDKVDATIQTMNRQIKRLKKYVTGMSDVQKLEDLSPNLKDYSLTEISEELKSYAQMLVKEQRLVFEGPADDQVMKADMKMVSEVFGNLVSNATRYGKSEIAIKISVKGEQLAIIVADDGPGFSDQALVRALEPYYRSSAQSAEHFGLGLYISDILCDKHGGKLVISNGKNGGGEIIAIFQIK